MEFSVMLQRLWRLRVFVALGVLVASVVAIFSAFDVDFGDRTLTAPRSEFGAAQTTVYIDTRRPFLVSGGRNIALLTARAQLLARFLGSGTIRADAGERLGVPASQITVTGPSPDNPGAQNSQPVAQQRANALLGRGSAFSVFVDTEANVPTITLFTQARSGPEAIALASAMVAALEEFVRQEATNTRADDAQTLRDQIRVIESRQDRTVSSAEERQLRADTLAERTVVRALGRPVGGAVVDQSGSAIGVVVFVVFLVGWCIALLLITSVLQTSRTRT